MEKFEAPESNKINPVRLHSTPVDKTLSTYCRDYFNRPKPAKRKRTQTVNTCDIFSTNGDRSQFKIVCVKVKRFAHFSLPKRHCRTVCLRYALELLLLLLLFKLFGYLPFQIPYHPMDTCSLRFY